MALSVVRAALLRRTAIVGALSAAFAASSAQARTYDFDLPPQPLSRSLDAVARISGQQVIYQSDLVEGKNAPPLHGTFSPDVALADLVKGTGLTATPTPAGDVMIEPVVQVAQATSKPRPAPRAAASSGVETVVVTAEKKTEDIQTVPIAVSAFTQKQLTERQVAGGPDLVKEVPNLTFSKTNFSGYNLEIRGIGTQAISVTTDPAVAVAFNGIPFIRNHFFEQEFYDLDNLEVLRGPQGTLYGRNATAGVVNVISAKPTDEYAAMLSADLGNYSNRRLEAMLNIPIVGDTLDIRLAGEWTKRKGYTFDSSTDTHVDGRDLWSGRATIAWKPVSNLQTYLVFEHFSEDDDRLRSGKQLCKTSPIPASVLGVPVPDLAHDPLGGALSQGCEDTSLYSPDAFQVPNGFSLPYYADIATQVDIPIQTDFDPYASATQSPNLRSIESSILPHYRAKNDLAEFNVDWTLSPALTLTSQTGYNSDFLYSTEDFNRFTSRRGSFVNDDCIVCGHPLGITSPDPLAGTNGVPLNSGIFCDPQLGCSDRLEAEDLSVEHAWQLSQEFRLASSFSGPLNFSVGGNYLHYETEESYYVFINTVTVFALFDNFGIYDLPLSAGSTCGGFHDNLSFPSKFANCKYVDPNPIGSLDNQGHNYFLSQNPYDLNSYALFGELYYDIASDLKLTAGLRLTEDEKHFVDIPSEILLQGYGYSSTGTVDQRWLAPTGRLAVNWTPKLDFTDQTLLYASVAHGYKAGGANPPGAVFPCIQSCSDQVTNPIHPLKFKPEYIDALELGTKNTLFDGGMTLNGDVFFYNYTGYQISEIVDRTAINNNFNARVYGAEFESSWEPLPGLKFSLAQGYERTNLDKGDKAIDLMDRTAGNPNWMVVKPNVTEASNCILPAYVVAALTAANSSSGFDAFGACTLAYTEHLDPVTRQPYVADPTVGFVYPASYTGPNPYPGFDPSTAPNNGEGFAKSLGGHHLPNAPKFTTSFTAEYRMPVWADWAATLHGDFYWQDSSWARVFQDSIDKTRGYYNLNLSLILTSANGWQVMGYVKNVLDTTAITGSFLNSDDTGLTTNVFLTDPRLFGVRVTKHLDAEDGFWGSEYSGSDFFTGLFSDVDGGKPQVWIELGGELARLADSQDAYAPPFLPAFTIKQQQRALDVQRPPTYSADEQAAISFAPEGSDWVVSASVKIGRSAASKHLHQQTPNSIVQVLPHTIVGYPYPGYSIYPNVRAKFADGRARSSQSHVLLDFLVGKDVGLGVSGTSTVSGGVRVAQFISSRTVHMSGVPDLQYGSGPLASFPAKYEFLHTPRIWHHFTGDYQGKASFQGLGPELDWKASTPIAGTDTGNGEITFDWGLDAALLFGRQKASGAHKTESTQYNCPFASRETGPNPNLHLVQWVNCQVTATSANAPHNRSRIVTVPNLGGFAGLSIRYRNAKVSFGYRADHFFGAMDGGIDSRRTYDRGFYGPFAKISLGLGG